MNLGDELDKAFPAHTLPPSSFDDAGRYVELHLAAALMRGEYRILPDGGIRACCLACGRIIHGADQNTIPPDHDCVPAPDPED
jgi:hypothetical protein